MGDKPRVRAGKALIGSHRHGKCPGRGASCFDALGDFQTVLCRHVRPALLGVSLVATSLATLSGAMPAQAQGRLDARYVVTLAGLPIGKGAWVIDIAEDQFTAAASGSTSGLLQVFSNGSGSGASRGQIVGGKPVPASYASNVTTDRKTEEIRISIARGNVKDYAIVPPLIDSPERIPVTEAHRNGVQDPMTASLIRVPGNGDLMRPEACQQAISVFDGRMRYDLKLVYKRMDKVRADKGYDGPVVVCTVQFTPVSGYVPSRPAIKYLIQQRDIEVWLAPIAATRVVVPFRLIVPTPMGTGILNATQFVTASQKPRAAAAPPSKM
jgi:hypothetical protein